MHALDLACEAERLSKAVLAIEDRGGGNALSVCLMQTRSTAVYDRQVRLGRPGETRIGQTGAPEFWIELCRIEPVENLWCPTIAQAITRADEIEARMVREQKARNVAHPGDLHRLAEAERAAETQRVG